MMIKFFFLFSLLAGYIDGYCQKKAGFPERSADPAYGFTAGTPLKMKKGEPVQSVRYAEIFLAGIDSIDGQSVQYIGRITTRDPNHKKPFIQLTDRFTGRALTGRGGILDVYRFIKTRTKDTVSFFVDIYHKGTLQIPVGCKLKAEE